MAPTDGKVDSQAAILNRAEQAITFQYDQQDVMGQNTTKVGDSVDSLHGNNQLVDLNQLQHDSVMRLHFECKMDNRNRLRQVKNLEDLVKFNIKTVADRLVEDGAFIDEKSAQKGLYGLRRVVDPLLVNSNFPHISKNRHPNHNVYSDSSFKQMQRRLRDKSWQPRTRGMTSLEASEGPTSHLQSGRVDEAQALPDKLPDINQSTDYMANRMSVEEQINEALKLDDKDPIRKLQLFFNKGKDGTKMIPKPRGIKTTNYIMWKYEQKNEIERKKQHERQQFLAQAKRSQTVMESNNHPEKSSLINSPSSASKLEYNPVNSKNQYDSLGAVARNPNQTQASHSHSVPAIKKQYLNEFVVKMQAMKEMMAASLQNYLNFEEGDDTTKNLKKLKQLQENSSFCTKSPSLSSSVDRSMSVIEKQESSLRELSKLEEKNQNNNMILKYMPQYANELPAKLNINLNEEEMKEEMQTRAQRQQSLLKAVVDVQEPDEANYDDQLEILNQITNKEYEKLFGKNQEQDLANKASLTTDQEYIQKVLDKRLKGGSRIVQLSQDEKNTLQESTLGKNQISILSKISSVQRKDYIKYSQEQLELYKMVMDNKVADQRKKILDSKHRQILNEVRKEALQYRKELVRSNQRLRKEQQVQIQKPHLPKKKYFTEDDQKVGEKNQTTQVDYNMYGGAFRGKKFHNVNQKIPIKKKSKDLYQLDIVGPSELVLSGKQSGLQSLGSKKQKHQLMLRRISQDEDRSPTASGIDKSIGQSHRFSQESIMNEDLSTLLVGRDLKEIKSIEGFQEIFRMQQKLDRQSTDLYNEQLPEPINKPEQITINASQQITENEFEDHRETSTAQIQNMTHMGSTGKDGKFGKHFKQQNANDPFYLESEQYTKRENKFEDIRQNQLASRQTDCKILEFEDSIHTIKGGASSINDYENNAFMKDSGASSQQEVPKSSYILKSNEMKLDSSIHAQAKSSFSYYDGTNLQNKNSKFVKDVSLKDAVSTMQISNQLVSGKLLEKNQTRSSNISTIQVQKSGVNSLEGLQRIQMQRLENNQGAESSADELENLETSQLREKSATSMTLTASQDQQNASQEAEKIKYIPQQMNYRQIKLHFKRGQKGAKDEYVGIGIMQSSRAANVYLKNRQNEGNYPNLVQSERSQNIDSDQALIDREYHSATEAIDSSQQVDLMNDVVETWEKSGKPGWQAKRFKRFPRFSIYLQRDQSNQEYLQDKYISLNNKILNYLQLQDEAMENSQMFVVEEEQQAQPSLEVQAQQKQFVQSTILNSDITMDPSSIIGSTNAQNSIAVHPQMKKSVSQEQIVKEVQANLRSNLATEESENKQKPVHTNYINQSSRGHSSRDADQETLKQQVSSVDSPSLQPTGNLQKMNYKHTEPEVQTQESVVAQHDRSLNQVRSMVDPFEKVLLIKNIDNAILTSFRTLSKQNNIVSATQKIIHTKFTPINVSKHVKKLYRRAQNYLYAVSEVESDPEVEVNFDQSQNQQSRETQNRQIQQIAVDPSQEIHLTQSLNSQTQTKPHVSVISRPMVEQSMGEGEFRRELSTDHSIMLETGIHEQGGDPSMNTHGKETAYVDQTRIGTRRSEKSPLGEQSRSNFIIYHNSLQKEKEDVNTNFMSTQKQEEPDRVILSSQDKSLINILDKNHSSSLQMDQIKIEKQEPLMAANNPKLQHFRHSQQVKVDYNQQERLVQKVQTEERTNTGVTPIVHEHGANSYRSSKYSEKYKITEPKGDNFESKETESNQIQRDIPSRSIKQESKHVDKSALNSKGNLVAKNKDITNHLQEQTELEKEKERQKQIKIVQADEYFTGEGAVQSQNAFFSKKMVNTFSLNNSKQTIRPAKGKRQQSIEDQKFSTKEGKGQTKSSFNQIEDSNKSISTLPRRPTKYIEEPATSFLIPKPQTNYGKQRVSQLSNATIEKSNYQSKEVSNLDYQEDSNQYQQTLERMIQNVNNPAALYRQNQPSLMTIQKQNNQETSFAHSNNINENRNQGMQPRLPKTESQLTRQSLSQPKIKSQEELTEEMKVKNSQNQKVNERQNLNEISVENKKFQKFHLYDKHQSTRHNSKERNKDKYLDYEQRHENQSVRQKTGNKSASHDKDRESQIRSSEVFSQSETNIMEERLQAKNPTFIQGASDTLKMTSPTPGQSILQVSSRKELQNIEIEHPIIMPQIDKNDINKTASMQDETLFQTLDSYNRVMMSQELLGNTQNISSPYKQNRQIVQTNVTKFSKQGRSLKDQSDTNQVDQNLSSSSVFFQGKNDISSRNDQSNNQDNNLYFKQLESASLLGGLTQDKSNNLKIKQNQSFESDGDIYSLANPLYSASQVQAMHRLQGVATTLDQRKVSVNESGKGGRATTQVKGKLHKGSSPSLYQSAPSTQLSSLPTKSQLQIEQFKNQLMQNIGQPNGYVDRVVKPEASYKLKSMVAAVFQMRDKLDYCRENCFGNQNVIFDLEASHLVDRSAAFNKEVRQIERNMKAQKEKDALKKITSTTYLEANKAPMEIVIRKPIEIRKYLKPEIKPFAATISRNESDYIQQKNTMQREESKDLINIL